MSTWPITRRSPNQSSPRAFDSLDPASAAAARAVRRFFAPPTGTSANIATEALETGQHRIPSPGPFEGYAPEEDRPPLGAYALPSGVFLGAWTAFFVAARRDKVKLPEDVSVKDVVMIGAATHKLSRLVAKDKVTSFLRAPFRRYQEAAGQGELSEETRGRGIQAAIGELLGCPYCLGLWIATGMTGSLVVAPRETRLAGSMLVGLTISDFLQLGYGAGQEKL